jgi:hypothetical protein
MDMRFTTAAATPHRPNLNPISRVALPATGSSTGVRRGICVTRRSRHHRRHRTAISVVFSTEVCIEIVSVLPIPIYC